MSSQPDVPEFVELHPDLQSYVGVDFAADEGSILWESLKHPLVFMVPYHPGMNEQLNNSYLHKSERLAEAERDGKFETQIWLHERPYRLLAFYQRMHQMPDKLYWNLLGDIWTDAEWPHVNLRLWRRLFLDKRPQRHALMTRQERETLQGLPDPILAYRGVNNGFEEGISWTTSLDKARWFAKRWDQADPTVLSMSVPKDEVIAYLDHRNEDELVIPRARKFKAQWRRLK